MIDSAQLETCPTLFPKCGHPRTPENTYMVRSQNGQKYPCCKTCVKAKADARRRRLISEGVAYRMGQKWQRDRIIEVGLKHYLSVAHPITERHLYYKLRTHDQTQFIASLNLCDSSMKNFEALVSAAICEARLDGRVDWECIYDPGRRVFKTDTWESKKEWMDYWKNAWDDSRLRIERQAHIECWVEKDTLLGGLTPFCREHQITLRSCHGQAGDDMLYRASEDFHDDGLPVEIFYYGDLDESGVHIENAIRRKFTNWDLFEGLDIALTRLGLTELDAEQLQIQDDPEVDALDDSDLQERLLAEIKRLT